MNKMTITALLWGNNSEYLVPIHSNNDKAMTEDEMIIGRRRPTLKTTSEPNTMRDLLLGACLCNNAAKQSSTEEQTPTEDYYIETNGQEIEVQTLTTKLVGDAADVALYNFCEDKCQIDIENVRKNNFRINSLPFNSKNKFMITANLIDNQQNVLITLKGAPDFVLARCSTYKQDDGDQQIPITDQFIKSIQRRQEALGKSGYRVIAMLQQTISKNTYQANIEAYNHMKKQQNQMKSQEPDLNGLPANNYCFIGKKYFSFLLFLFYFRYVFFT